MTTDHLSLVEAARHAAQEARTLLTSLRGGPPHVARGDLAQDVMDLRHWLLQQCQQNSSTSSSSNNNNNVRATSTTTEEEATATASEATSPEFAKSSGVVTTNDDDDEEEGTTSAASTIPEPAQAQQPQQISFLVRPFLQVITDPRAAGPHTLVALQCLHRLFLRGTCRRFGGILLQPCLAQVLCCKFEQTDAGADEAVEMAIANVVACLVCQEEYGEYNTATAGTGDSSTSFQMMISNDTFMDALNTVFITRNTFLHSPALCHALEDVLTTIVQSVFAATRTALRVNTTTPTTQAVQAAKHYLQRAYRVLEFLTHQLLHTPLEASDNAIVDESALEERQLAHDATRILSLKLVRVAIHETWGVGTATTSRHSMVNDAALVSLVQDQVCLSLLMTGQVIWAHHQATTAAATPSPASLTEHDSPGVVSLQVLSEICSTIQTLWHTLPLRPYLIPQFETIFTGFYTRALVLLRKRKQPINSLTFHANLIFDSEVEIILESLVDLLCLHDPSHSIADSTDHHQTSASSSQHPDGGSLETMFAYYDCNLNAHDVAAGLMVELCRCCGGTVNEEGDVVLRRSSNSSTGSALTLEEEEEEDEDLLVTAPTAAAADGGGGGGRPAADAAAAAPKQQQANNTLVQVNHPRRAVPAHVKELCARALIGSMQCLFLDDHASADTLQARSHRNRSILTTTTMTMPVTEVPLAAATTMSAPPPPPTTTTAHMLRDIKAKKRLTRKAARVFNNKASQGIAYMIDSGLMVDTTLTQGGDAKNQNSLAHQVALFLRNAVVVGLDKAAVGAYLGEAGKAPQAGKSPPSWERDWFHKQVLQIYCSTFSFENQTVLDGLRMFLASFRLPGEAQQIDRILQAFADCCSARCEESKSGLFSADPKRASDAAYLLSFSIIMLNTDRHNANIPANRKMSMKDFVRNNTDYGRDITERGKELPAEYLQGIYKSISQEEIRTEREGAQGNMTVERWKDVMASAAAAAASSSSNVEEEEEEAAGGGGGEASPLPRPVLTEFHASAIDAEDLTELVLEHVWKPIVSAIGALWGIKVQLDDVVRVDHQQSSSSSNQQYHLHAIHMDGGTAGGGGGMLGSVQGARLGMDLSMCMLLGVSKQLQRLDIFRKILSWVCDYSGLLPGEYTTNAVERTVALTHSVESQSAVVVALTAALEAGEHLEEDGWKRVWAILFELRDLKLIPTRGRGNLLAESDADLLSDTARREWNICLAKGDMSFEFGKGVTAGSSGQQKDSSISSYLGSMLGRALFGSSTATAANPEDYEQYAPTAADDPTVSAATGHATLHGKEDLVIWDEGALSDEEDDGPVDEDDVAAAGDKVAAAAGPVLDATMASTPGGRFESVLIRESLDLSRQMDMPVTGLERMPPQEETRRSPRALVRERFRRICHFSNLVTDTRFLNDAGMLSVSRALVELLALGNCRNPPTEPSTPGGAAAAVYRTPPPSGGLSKRMGSDSISCASTASFSGSYLQVPLSPASEAFGEVLLCEIAVRNKDRLKLLWTEVLREHYMYRLTPLLEKPAGGGGDAKNAGLPKVPVDPGLEKRISGLLRISLCAIRQCNRRGDDDDDDDIANSVLSIWGFVLPKSVDQDATSPLRILHRHFGQGVWRISQHTEELGKLDDSGWEGFMTLLTLCARLGTTLKPIRRQQQQQEQQHPGGTAPGLGPDDPALLAYRSLHLLLNAEEESIAVKLPRSTIDCLRLLSVAGDKRNCSQLSIAALDLLLQLLSKKLKCLQATTTNVSDEGIELVPASDSSGSCGNSEYIFWSEYWRKTIEVVAEAADLSTHAGVRQHALSMLTDLFLDKDHGGEKIPSAALTGALSEVCIPVAGRSIAKLQTGHRNVASTTDELMIEFELCIGLIFKPMRHHLVRLGASSTAADATMPGNIWKAVLAVLEELFKVGGCASSSDDAASGGSPNKQPPPIPRELKSTMDNLVIEHLQNAIQVLLGAGVLNEKMSSMTWEAVKRMGVSDTLIREWQTQAAASSGSVAAPEAL